MPIHLKHSIDSIERMLPQPRDTNEISSEWENSTKEDNILYNRCMNEPIVWFDDSQQINWHYDSKQSIRRMFIYNNEKIGSLNENRKKEQQQKQ